MKKPPAFAEGFPFAVIGVPACTAVLNIHSKQQKATLAFPSLNILAGEPALWAGGGGNEPPYGGEADNLQLVRSTHFRRL